MIAKYKPARALIFVMVLTMILGLMPMSAYAATYTDEIELDTHSVILVDRSGSVKNREKVDAILQEINPEKLNPETGEMEKEFPEVHFDSRGIILDDTYVGGGDSPICEALDDVVRGGFTHVIIVTDGEQWPQKYDALGIYRNLDIRIILTEEMDVEAQQLVDQLQLHMIESSLKVQTPSGEEIVLMDEYKPETITVEIEIPDPVIEEPEPEDDEDPGDEESDPGPTVIQTVECDHECKGVKCWWWLALLLGILIAALFDFIHELIARRGWFGPTVGKVKKGAKMLLDVSGSMSNYASAVVRAAKRGKAESIIAFGDQVLEVLLDEVAKLSIGGATLGVEALKRAAANGWEEIILVSDLQFNGEALNVNDFPVKFKCITVLAPNPYNMAMISELQQIADRVEVLSL